MDTLIRTNALKSTLGSLVPNAGMTWLTLRSAPLVTLIGPMPNLLSVMLPAVFMTALVTTLLTFSAITAARKHGQLSPALPAETPWFAKAAGVGLGIGGLFAGLVALLLCGLKAALATAHASRLVLVLLAGAIGMVVALLAALLAGRRALGLGTALAGA